MSKRQHNRGQSLFGPIILIGVGVFFLLRNFGVVPQANFGILFQMWPLWLIFLGVNIVVQQAPKRLAGLLSGLVAITAVFTASYLVFFSEDNALLARLGIRTAPAELTTETISFDPEDVSRADVSIDFSMWTSELYALEPSAGLIEGEIVHSGTMRFEGVEEDNGEASVSLSTESGGPWGWSFSGDGTPWQIGLNPRTPLDLFLDGGSGSLDLDLGGLTLEQLEIDLGSGSSQIVLPSGEYEATIDVGSGSSRIAFGENGRVQIDIDGGSGSIVLTIPDNVPAQIEINDGSGSFSMPDRFTLVEGERNDDSIWETANYSRTGDGLTLYVDVGSGSVRVQTGDE